MEMVEIQANKKIGGVGMTVEVDEYCFGHCKVKYNNAISLFVLFVLYFYSMAEEAAMAAGSFGFLGEFVVKGLIYYRIYLYNF